MQPVAPKADLTAIETLRFLSPLLLWILSAQLCHRSISVHINFFTLLFVCEQQLKQQRDKLRQYQKKMTLQMEKEKQLAKQLLKDGKKE